MSKVYIIARDPKKNMLSARKYGELSWIFDDSRNIGPGMFTCSEITKELNGKLANYQESDFLIANGDPAIMALVCHALFRKFGKINLVKWDRQSQEYYVAELSFPQSR